MFTKVLPIGAVLLLLAAYGTNAMMSCDCGDMSAADCKEKLSKEMDKMVMMKMMEIMKTNMMKRIEMYTMMKDGMPMDSMHTTIMMKAINDMKTEMNMMDKMDGMTMMEMKDMIERCMKVMQPDFTKAQTEDSTNMEKFNEMMDKHGPPKDMMDDMRMMMMKEFEMMMKGMEECIRDMDRKEYPQYDEITAMLKTMMETTDRTEKMKMLKVTMKKMMEFKETPFMMAMMKAMCEDC